MLKPGIYCIENIYNGKMYIGSSFKVDERIAAHFSFLKRRKSHSKHLQAAYDKYGKDAFIGYVVELCEKDEVKEREQFWIDNTSCVSNGYNKSTNVIDNSGWNHSEEFKVWLSEKRVGSLNPQFGKKLTDAQKEVVRINSTGRLHKPQAIEKMVVNRKNNKHKYVGSKSGKALLTEEKVLCIKKQLAKGVTFSKLSADFSISLSAIGGIFNNRRWRHVVCEEFNEYMKTYSINSRQLGEANCRAKLTENDIRQIRRIKGKSFGAISRIYNISDTSVANIIKMKTWKNVV